MIETRLLMPGEEPEYSDKPGFIGTKDGWFVNTPTLFGIAHVKANKGPQTLGELKASFRMNDKMIPQWLIMKAHDLFKKVWDKQQTEAMVYIIHHPVEDRFNLWVPEQYVSGASVSYRLQPGQIKGGWQAVGTIHSHCNFGAFHSGTDQHDMDGMPGLHITIGHVDRDWPEFAIALSANGDSFDVSSIEDIMDREAIKDHKGYDDAPDWWMDLIKKGASPWTGSTVKYNKGPAKKTSFTYSKDHFKQKPIDTSWQWDSWTDDDWDGWVSFGTSHVPQEEKTKELPPGHTQIGLDDLIEGNVDDPFRLFEDEVALSTKVMDEEVEQMAYLGFQVQYTIQWNPKAAVEWLRETGRDDEFIDPKEWE